MSTDFATHLVLTKFAAAKAASRSAFALSVDLAAAFYSVVRQQVISIPVEEADFMHLLGGMPLSPALQYALQRLGPAGILDRHIDDNHFKRLVSETQTHGFW